MKARDPELLLQHGPFLQQQMTTRKVMLDVIIALAPATLASFWHFGISAVVVLMAAIAGAVSIEMVATRKASIADGSGLVTGLILGLTLPPGLPIWMAFLGGVVAIGLGKIIWGGLGSNLFNPALVGRAFLLATFPTAMTTWSSVNPSFWLFRESNFSLPFAYSEGVDAISAATPLGLMKFEQQATPLTQLMLGNTAGSLGETSGLLLILGGAYLLWRRDLDWRIPVGMLGSVLLFSALLTLTGSGFPPPLFSLFSGGLLLGAIYMATDPVTSPITPLGTWIFGISIGFLVVLIRVFGGMPEGVMYAILLMNAATPLIDRFTQPRVFGYARKDS